MDINNVLAGIVEEIKNTASTSSTKQSLNREDLLTLVGEVIAKENSKLSIEFQSDMSQLKEELQTEA